MAIWNPWHGCKKLSPGCANCYVYRRDESIGKDASVVTKTGDYDLPLKRNRQKLFKLTEDDGVVYTCMTSDFFLEEADVWRDEAWKIIRQRSDVKFFLLTKRPQRVMSHLPADWHDGYENVFFNVSTIISNIFSFFKSKTSNFSYNLNNINFSSTSTC